MKRRYCEPCDALVLGLECPRCGADTVKAPPMKRPTRQEQLKGLADAGIDTWADYREER